MFWSIFQNSQRNFSLGVSFLYKIVGDRPVTLLKWDLSAGCFQWILLIKKIPHHSSFSVSFAKFFGTASLQTHHGYSTLKWRGNDRFRVVSKWNARGVFVGFLIEYLWTWASDHSMKLPNILWKHSVYTKLAMSSLSQHSLKTQCIHEASYEFCIPTFFANTMYTWS